MNSNVDRKETQKQRWRDLLKSVIVKETGDMVYILLGVENQSDIHYAMPVKNMIYDGMNYGAGNGSIKTSSEGQKLWFGCRDL